MEVKTDFGISLAELFLSLLHRMDLLLQSGDLQNLVRVSEFVDFDKVSQESRLVLHDSKQSFLLALPETSP